MTGMREGHAIFSVSNDGPHIPPSEVDRLFQPFQRLRAERSGHREGLGIGLSIVAAIADVHDATVDVHARPQGGLTITMSFSVAVPHVNGTGAVDCPSVTAADPIQGRSEALSSEQGESFTGMRER